MSDVNQISTDIQPAEGGRIIFADDVIATIAALAANEVEGIAGMSGGVADGIGEMLGRKNLTKGVKVEVGAEEAAVDISVLIRYGFKIQEVCLNIQKAIKSAIETMTGLRVVEVNVYVQAVSFETSDPKADRKKEKEDRKREKEEKEKEKEAEIAAIEPEQPRVK